MYTQKDYEDYYEEIERFWEWYDPDEFRPNLKVATL